MNIVKVELLWSRDCPLHCAGCAMPLDQLQRRGYLPARADSRPGGTPEQWAAGVQRMRALGSQFVAIYGAEPLQRPLGLPQVVSAIYGAGMQATVITATPRSARLRQLLRESPLDSVTCSFDALDGDAAAHVDADRLRKSLHGLEALRALPQLADRALVATVSCANVDQVPRMAQAAHDAGCWFLFDLLHCPHSAPHLSKCRREDPDPSTRPPGIDGGRAMFARLLEMKRAGLRIHASEPYLAFMSAQYSGHARLDWHCINRHQLLPDGHSPVGWLTVDHDGAILACDDWQMVYPRGRIWDPFDAEDLAQWLRLARAGCDGCAWNTHFDAVAIEAGAQPRGTYVHTTATGGHG